MAEKEGERRRGGRGEGRRDNHGQGGGETQGLCRVVGHTQQSKAPRWKVLQIGTPQSKLLPQVTVNDVRDMFAKDATIVFWERRRGKSKKLYINYTPKETIAISNKDNDD